jgi:hypothetical protein
MFGRYVGGHHWITGDAADAGDVDDRAAIAHVPERVLQSEECAASVDGHDAVELGFVEVGHGRSWTGNAGGMDDRVNGAMCGGRRDVSADVGGSRPQQAHRRLSHSRHSRASG